MHPEQDSKWKNLETGTVSKLLFVKQFLFLTYKIFISNHTKNNFRNASKFLNNLKNYKNENELNICNCNMFLIIVWTRTKFTIISWTRTFIIPVCSITFQALILKDTYFLFIYPFSNFVLKWCTIAQYRHHGFWLYFQWYYWMTECWFCATFVEFYFIKQ